MDKVKIDKRDNNVYDLYVKDNEMPYTSVISNLTLDNIKEIKNKIDKILNDK